MRMLIKDTVREIKKSLGRFISILAIVAIGVAFFAGIKASAPVMKTTADQYFDDYNLMDIRVLSTLGLSDEDVRAIAAFPEVEGIYPTYTMDALIKVNTHEHALKVMPLPEEAIADNKDYINQAKLVEGRMPKNNHECVVEAGKVAQVNLKIGDKIQLYSGNDNSLEESMKVTEFEIVGKVNTPFYLSYQKGSTNIGNGNIDGFVMVKDDVFTSDIYTDLYITLKGAKKYNSYEEAYFDELIDPFVEKLENLGEVRSQIRSKDVKAEAYTAYYEGMNAYHENKQLAEEEFMLAEKKLNDGYDELLKGREELAQQKIDFAATIEENRQKIIDGRLELIDAKALLKQKEADFELTKAETMNQLKQLQEGIAMLEQEKIKVENGLAEIEAALAMPLPDYQKKALLEKQAEAVAGLKQINEQLLPLKNQNVDVTEQFAEGERQLQAAAYEIEANEKLLDQSETALEIGIREADIKFAEAENKLILGEIEYHEGISLLEEEKKIAEESFNDAKEELEKAEADLQKIDDCEWFVLDRHSHYSYMDYGSAADRMAAIAKVFPLFFFLVAALICLTTMTRMVDEQREVIGTLKALGYSKHVIALKYISYAFISSLAGAVIGVCVGFVIFPLVVYNAWNIMYQLPSAQLMFLPGLAVQASLSSILITLIATFAAVYKSLIETPASLMRPKAPKNGKRIFLERITFFWKRLSFSKKVTARNLFRYKKRFFMTVIGISGCTALLVAGFGIQDSISDIVSKQYDEIQKYDIGVQLEDDLNIVEKEKVFKEVMENDKISDGMEIAHYNGEAEIAGKDQNVVIFVPMDMNKFAQFTDLRIRKNHEPVQLEELGAVISEKMAKDLGVTIGDTFTCTNADEVEGEIRVTGIVENYIGHYIYMSAQSYLDVFGFTAKPTNLLLKVDNINDAIEDELGRELNQIDNVASLTFYRSSAESFAETINSLSIVVVVLVISAGLLAFVVLYNLTNVNISERIREIATIKVLGFYDNEVSTYVFRENLILSFIGALAGLLLGTGLHRLIMSLAELDSVMFGRTILPQSYLISVIITMLFSWLVAKVMHYKLIKIPMVESLKSVE